MTTDEQRIYFLRTSTDTCCVGVTRLQTVSGWIMPCGKAAVAVTVDGEGRWLPVCALHCRARKLVPLAEVLTAAEEFSWYLQ